MSNHSVVIEDYARWQHLKTVPGIEPAPGTTEVLIDTVSGIRYVTPAAAFQEF